jgi:hypothetical protein
LSCFGYRTDAQEKVGYLKDVLQPALAQYEQDHSSESYQDLCEAIEEGKKRFHPRVSGESSLRVQLMALEENVKKEYQPILDFTLGR